MFKINKINITTFYFITSLFLILSIAIEKKYNFYIYPVKSFLAKLPNKEQQMNDKIIELSSQIANLKKENEYLSKYKIIFSNLEKIHHIKSAVEIKHINDSVNGRFLIAQTNKGVQCNDLAVDDKNILIGRVVNLSKENNVKIQLLSDIHSNIPVYVNNSYGIIYGTNDGKCKIAFQNLSKVDPKDGDVVITSGFESLTIRGVVAGTISNLNGTWCVNNENIDHVDKLVIIGD